MSILASKNDVDFGLKSGIQRIKSEKECTDFSSKLEKLIF